MRTKTTAAKRAAFQTFPSVRASLARIITPIENMDGMVNAQ